MKRKKKQALTLIEIMVVVALIGIIGSVLGVNMKKSMDKAKAFKTKAHAQKIEDALNMYLAESQESPAEILGHIATVLKDSGLFKDAKDLLIDAYGRPYEIVFNNGEFVCTIQSETQK